MHDLSLWVLFQIEQGLELVPLKRRQPNADILTDCFLSGFGICVYLFIYEDWLASDTESVWWWLFEELGS